MSSLKKNDNGFTGLEAAIVLIAFVVVAAVFSYVVLGAGFFTTQKAQQTVYSAVGQASSTLEIIGNVYGTNPVATGATGDAIQNVTFNVGLAAGASSVDMSKVVLVYSNETQLATLNYTTSADQLSNPPNWAITAVQNSPGGSSTTMLQPNEQFTINCYLGNIGGIPANDKFTIELRPSVGAAISISRTVPAAVMPVNALY
jgi:flagellin FlaB